MQPKEPKPFAPRVLAAIALAAAGWAHAQTPCSQTPASTAFGDLSDLACPGSWAPSDTPDHGLLNSSTDATWDQFGIWNQGSGKDAYYTKYFKDGNGNILDAPTYGNIGMFGKDADGNGYTVVKIANSHLGGILLTSGNNVYTWGWNGQGQLGIGMPYINLPAKGTPAAKITTAQWTNLAYAGGYKLVDFFSDPESLYDRLNIPNAKRELTAAAKIIDVDAGYHHMIALDDQGRVWAWGYNQANQVGGCSGGVCKTAATYNFPQRVNGINASSKIVRVWANHGYLDRGQSFALTADGRVWSWGSNSNGKRGTGITTNTAAYQAQPAQVLFGASQGKPADAKIIDVQGGDYHNMALDDQGRVWAWGDGGYFGDGTPSKTVNVATQLNLSAIANKSDSRKIALPIQKIALSYDNALILDSKGVVWQAGNIYVGPAAGNPTTQNFKPVQYSMADSVGDGGTTGTGIKHNVGYMPYARDIGAGESVSFIVDQHGRSWAWGDGRYHGFGREGDYIRSYTKMRTTVAHQYPQVIGDGDTQRYTTDPAIPSGITGEKVDTPPDNKKFGVFGFNSLHPTIYDAKYKEANTLVPGTSSPITGTATGFTQAWQSLAFHPVPKIKKILGSRSGNVMVDTDGNLFKWAYDGSGTIAWGNGDYFQQPYDNTGNGRDGLYDAYCYEVMLAKLDDLPGAPPPCLPQPVPNLLTTGSTSSVGGSSTIVSANSVVYAAERKFDTTAEGGIGGYTGTLNAYSVTVDNTNTATLTQQWTATSPAPGTARQILTTKANGTTGISFEWGSPNLTDADVPPDPTVAMCTNPATGQDTACGKACMVPNDDPASSTVTYVDLGSLDAESASTYCPGNLCAGVDTQKTCPPKACQDAGGHAVTCQSLLPTPAQADVTAMRDQALGAVVNSQLVYVGPPALPSMDKDYLTFAKTVNNFDGASPNKYREGVVYVIANDSMLHGFDAGRGSSTATNGAPGTIADYGTGKELFAYVPRAMLAQLRSIGNGTAIPYWVDGGMFSGDAQLDTNAYGGDTHNGNNPGHWATLLVGTLGTGGPGYFVLDVTHPKLITENNLANNAVKPTLIDMTTPAAPPSPAAAPPFAIVPTAADTGTIGYQSSLPVMDQYNLTRQSAQITRINTRDAGGEWAVIMGNGYGSANGLPVLLIQSLSKRNADGTLVLYTVAAKCHVNGTAFTPDPGNLLASTPCQDAGNGLSGPRAVDVDGNGTADFVYAGDLMGNLWKFDISNVDKTKWTVAYGTNRDAPMFTAVGPTGVAQPITSAPVAVAYPGGGFMVGLGTGKNLEPGDLSDTNLNSFYALYDGQKIGASLVEIGSTDPKTLASTISLEAASAPLCAASGTGAARYSTCLYRRTDTAGLDTASVNGSQTLSSSAHEGKGNFNVAGNFGWYFDIPELAGNAGKSFKNAAKVLDNPSMMADNVVQFFSVNVPVATRKPTTTCDSPQPIEGTAEILAANYFALFTGAPADDITLYVNGVKTTYGTNAEKPQRNRFILPFGKYVRSGTNGFVRAPGSDTITYNAADLAGKRAGWRIGR